MNVQHYYAEHQNTLRFSREKSSEFAKDIAGDFNPIHDPDARRFCTPGDLLFSVLLQRHGLFRNLEVDFVSMVTDQSEVSIEQDENSIRFVDPEDKDFIVAKHDGELCGDASFVSELSEAYVQFSGQTFPHILVPVMREHQLMINPARPIVMYRKMELSMNTCGGENLSLAFTGSDFKSNGKKGEVALKFDIKSEDTVIGTGMKNMLLSGLRPFDESEVDSIIEQYDGWKSNFNTEELIAS